MHYNSRRWTVEETASLKQMKADGYKNKVIAFKLSRTEMSVAERWRWINKSEELKERRRLQVHQNRQLWRSNQAENIVTRSFRAVPEVLAERDYRLSLPRTIGQIVLGDPPPGYSALDRKRQGLPV